MSKEQQNLEITASEELDLSQDIPELSEDIELMGPGQMLAQAREKLGLSQQNIATKLNFRLTLVENIEADIYDPSLPETFNRGYLCGFAKLVNISNEDILNSYETLSIAKIQSAELQSFSRSTHKQAQNSMLTWISYLIVAILIGSTVMWWLQDVEQRQENTKTQNIETSVSSTVDKALTEVAEQNKVEPLLAAEPSGKAVAESSVDSTVIENIDNGTIIADSVSVSKNDVINVEPMSEQPPLAVATAIFTFSGDCWVSIYDATGERIAYGVKKTGYVMTISGKPPFKVDIGRPALTTIEFNGEAINMSQFDKDNIAKFTLPISVD